MFHRFSFFLTAAILSLSTLGLFADNDIDTSSYISSSSHARKNNKRSDTF